jgi:ribosome-associated toxin RatA of RatAB toxin-antitoxin module
MEIRKSALVGRSAIETFDLIEAAEHYPEFLPWCADAVILARNNKEVAARITIDFHGLRFALTTRNPKRRPRWMKIHLEQGPFRCFEGEWRVTELGADACRIDFDLRYEWGRGLTGLLARPIFTDIANTLVDAFARRAEQGDEL